MELVVIVIVFLLLFGGKKLGELGKGLGEGIRHFKTAVKSDDKDETKKT
jgi:sec-independent protein translocase protein TatA